MRYGGSTVPRRPPNRVRRAAGALHAPYELRMMGGPMTPVHFVAGRMWIDPAARPRKVTVVVEHREGEGDSIRAERVWAVKRKSGWRLYTDAQLDFDTPVTTARGTPIFFLWIGGPLDPRDEHVVWCWGWKSEAAKALAVSWALR